MQKILILAALPEGLRLDKEIREVRAAIERAKGRHLFKIEYRTAVQPQDIRRAIAEEHPSIVHFCGHGLEDGSLLLEDEGGNPKSVLPRGLLSLFKLHAERVKCVLLNACYSSGAAEAISQHIHYVIGMNQPIQDRAAIVFAQGFYDGLGYDDVNNQQVIQRAYDEGIVAIELENLFQQKFIPVLWENGKQKSKPTEAEEVSTPEVIETQSTVVTKISDDDLSSECPVNQSARLNYNRKRKFATQTKEDAIAEYRKKVEEFIAYNGEISFRQPEILKSLQEELRLTEKEVRAIEDEALKSLDNYQEHLEKYSQAFTKLVDEKGYPLSKKDKANLKKLKEFLKLKDEDTDSLFQEAEQKEAEKLRQQLEQELDSRQQPVPSDCLSSACEIDYTRLRDLLKAQLWKAANQETLAIMLKAAGKEKEGCLDSKSIEDFPCTDLRTIDQLWVKYSNGRFGFSVQQQIWESVASKAPKGHLPKVTRTTRTPFGNVSNDITHFLVSRLVKCNLE